MPLSFSEIHTTRSGPALPRLFWVGVIVALLPLVLEYAIRYPTTPSAPSGLYLLTYQALEQGGWVVACLPPEVARQGFDRGYLTSGRCPGFVHDDRRQRTSEVLKKVAALPGDEIEVGPGGLWVNGRFLPGTAPLNHDSQKRPLEQALSGPGGPFHVVPEGEIWLYSSYSPRSWDSRYYGGIPLAGVRSTAHLLSPTP